MKKVYIIAGAVFLLLFIVYQLHSLHSPVRDNDEGIYATTFALIQKGNAPYKTTFFSQPPGFLIAVYPFFTSFGSSLPAARLGIFIWSFIGMITIIWICFKLKKQYAGFLAVALLPFISAYLNQTQTFQSDIIVSTFSVLSLAFFLLFYETKKMLWLVLSTLFLNFAFWTKFDTSFVPAFIYGLFLYWGKYKCRMEEIAKQLMVILTSALVLFIVAIFPFGLQHLYTNIIALRLHAGTDVSSSISLLLPYLLRQPVLLVIMIAGIALSFVKRTNLKFPNILILIWSLFALAQLVLYRPLFPHHLSIVAIPFMLLFVLNIDNFSIKKFERQYQKVVPILVLASSLYIVILLSIQPTTLLTHTQQSTLKTIDSVTSPHDYVVTDEEILNVESGRLPPPELSDVSYVRIYSNNLSAQNFQSIIEKYKPKLIIPWNGRLASIQSLHLILEKYRPLQTIDSKTIYIFSP